MELSKNVIAIFDDLAKRFGVIIDWSEDNILPYLLDIFNRWRIYEIIINIIPLLLLICFMFIITRLYLSIRKEKAEINKELSTVEGIYDYKFHSVKIDYFGKSTIKLIDGIDTIFVVMGACTVFLACINFFTVSSLMKAIFVPELLFYELFFN